MENIQELSCELEEKIRRSNSVIYRRGRSILSEMGISTPQFNALIALKEFGPLTMGDLCRQLFTAGSTATDLADRLEREGLVERVRDSKDRRVVRMSLLPKGEYVVTAVIDERRHFLSKVLQEYNPEEHGLLLEILEQLVERMERMDKAHAVQFSEADRKKK